MRRQSDDAALLGKACSVGETDTQIHDTTKCPSQELFDRQECGALLPLGVGRFPFFHEARRAVRRNGHAEVDKGTIPCRRNMSLGGSGAVGN